MKIQLACHVGVGETVPDDVGIRFVCAAPGYEAGDAAIAGVVLPYEDEAHAARLLEGGAAQVFIGEAALVDCGVVERLARRFGTGRVGAYVPARRMRVDWSFETVSNADFKVVTPSVCEPCWEILRADGSGSGIRVHWWLGEMMKRGAAAALVRVDIGDDADLNLCAGLVEDLGERLWLGPLSDAAGDPVPALADWVAYGRLERIVLPPRLFARRADLLPMPEGENLSAPEVEAA